MSLVPTTSTVKVSNGVNVWYREAGDRAKPTFLLLHGFPTSSIMYRNLITILAPHFHVIAPDLPGYGFTEVPDKFEYTFANLTDTIELFVDAIKLTKFAIYIFDYGAPVGLRLALKRPHQITGIVTQNGNAYDEGLDHKFWGIIEEYWKTDANNTKYIQGLSQFVEDPKNIKDQYSVGFTNPTSVDPTPYYLDKALIERPGQTKIQVALFYDYQNNVKLYPQFQEYFRKSNVPVLATWGKNDYIFAHPGAEAYKRDVKNIKVKYYETGHFALEEFVNEIGADIIDFFGPILH
ncbi:epoxide hydrolase [Sugiyamaella lignohabitans]|uniref:Epoxide hydrolase n=1 Tax=Sugiyamaella lignohabitans TaxID=796027 RepID=A0A167C7V1_9ASCO|nr:epoxide hydrolase [Sugiyamaella lignohabitans]ANB11330.1 epoxide hydrolase [Sugiyamaella lignohabitans]